MPASLTRNSHQKKSLADGRDRDAADDGDDCWTRDPPLVPERLHRRIESLQMLLACKGSASA